MYNNHLAAFVIYLYIVKIVIFKVKTECEGERKSLGICIGMCEVHTLYEVFSFRPKSMFS